MADALKAAGNAAFSAGDYDAAIAKFTEVRARARRGADRRARVLH